MPSNNSTPPTVDKYIANFPEDIQQLLQKVRATIRAAAPKATETIRYQIPTFQLHGNLVHFAAHQNHLGFYPSPSAIKAFGEELSAYETSKGTVKFPLDQPLPLDLIDRIVRFRVQENLEKAAAKRKRKK